MRGRGPVGLVAALAILAPMLSSCGGSDGATRASASTGAGGAGGTTGVVTTPANGCALRARQDWVLAQMNEWYLFPDLLPTNVDPGTYTTVDAYLDALTVNARAQRRDRFFTYLTSVAEERAYYESGATAGIGVRLAFDGSNRLFVTEAFEGGPALAAGVDRGAQIVAIGSSTTTLRPISDILSTGTAELDRVLDTSTPGTTRVLRITDASGTREVTVSSTNYAVSPVSTRYGSKVIDDNGRKVGYVNLRTFIDTADDQLRSAFAGFRAQGITQVIVDLRYNGGGLLRTAETFTDLLGANRSTGDVQAYTTFRASKSSENETRRFAREAQAIAPTRVAFIGTGQTASASEYVINALVPYLRGDLALVGSNTYGKPVGQIALDNPSCSDDRLRVIAFALQNADRQGDYYDGLATKVGATCQAPDDYTRPLGDPNETSVRTALDWLAGRGCTRIGASASATRMTGLFEAGQRPVTAANPTAAQRDMPGLF
ncbi:C-terminal processing protease CtpA/Prc [Sphingomonas sp. BE138]|uniref:S41 family peptidase n=1 Tax=Sphingomonas sp. BE138 TaxID=2817845 RepID=UPI00285C4C09|nr:S41 family peptidase [Sphingomonas sp. BE138]MDR6788744.1 C-terminal processing protease CtpA/Prc [Sphingomonas sp. BE138]